MTEYFCGKYIINMYKNAKSKVKINGNILAGYFMCNIGVRQGEDLSPVLFALFLNDLQAYIARDYGGLKMVDELVNELLSDDVIDVYFRLYVLLYADDTIILAESETGLQQALNSMYKYIKVGT